MSKRVRVGMIGTSGWANMLHLPSLKSHPQAEIAAICGRNREHAEEVAKKYEIPVVYTDYREMIEKGDLQAVVVAAPDDMHYPMVMNALDAGLHVLCEKPMASNVSQAREMYEKAKAMGVKHMVYFTYRWMPSFRYIRELIDEGCIGRCLSCHFRSLSGSGRSLSGWRYDRQRGCGILGDLGSHMIDLALWYIGDIARVSASLAVFADQAKVSNRNLEPANNSAVLTVEFVNGAHGVIQASGVAHVGNRTQQQNTMLHGDSGTLESAFSLAGEEIRASRIDEEDFSTLSVPDRFWDKIDRSKPIISQIIETFTRQNVGDRLFIDAILGDLAVSPDFYDGLKVQEVIDAAIDSHQNGRWVSLQEHS
jgi:predicted dehydrogenase